MASTPPQIVRGRHAAAGGQEPVETVVKPLARRFGRSRSRLAVAALAVAAVAGSALLGLAWHPFGDPAASPPVAIRSAPPLERSAYASAVYLMPLNAGAPDPVAVMRATGQTTYLLTFILARQGACQPAWDGTRAVASDRRVAAVVDAIRAAGGDAGVAFGGGRGTKLGQACPDAATTAAAYQAVIDRYHFRAIDLDLEDPEWRDAGAVAREIGAMQILERDNPGLYVSITLPGLQDRVATRALMVFEMAKAIGFTPDNFSVMPFDFKGSDPMGPAAVDSLEATHAALMTVFGWDSWDAYRHEGVSLMNGRTDQGEHYYTADFETVLDYAVDHRLGRYTYWALNRDRECDPIDNNGRTSGACSSVAQEPWAFTRFTARFAALAAPGPETASVGTAPSPPDGR